jgi:hypothetical protein
LIEALFQALLSVISSCSTSSEIAHSQLQYAPLAG